MIGEVDFKGQKYTIRELKYGEWRRLLKLRKEAFESKDEYLMAESLANWIKAVTNITDQDLDGFTLKEAMDFIVKLGEAHTLPLQPKESSLEASLQTIQP